MRTDTSCGSEPSGAGPRSISYRTRGAGASRDCGVVSNSFSRRVAITHTGACAIGTKPFVEVETVTMTICDTAPAIGASASSRPMPFRATLNETPRSVCVPMGGNTVADTAIALLTPWAGAAGGIVASAIRIAANARCRPETERLRAPHPRGSSTFTFTCFASHAPCRHCFVTQHESRLTRYRPCARH